ncbi:MAG: L-serine ammonia-lyase, iron-sulfur-dependent, subunit alpha [Oscillospiraceae bacterium]
MDQQTIDALRAAMENGMKVATGCTEPVAIAYAAATAYAQTAGEILRLELRASGSIIKNAFVVGIPGTKFTGPKYAAAIGAYCGDPLKKLELLERLDPEKVSRAAALVERGDVTLARADSDCKLYIEVELTTEQDVVNVKIIGSHTHIAAIVKNGETLYSDGCYATEDDTAAPCAPAYTLAELYEYCTEAPLTEFALVRQAIDLNLAIAQEGLRGDYGLQVGKTLQAGVADGLLGDDSTNYAMTLAAAAADARMAGVSLPVMSNSGSGNQGIAATLPVVALWRRLDGKDEARLLRACALSNLTTIYIKSKFGVLSALCGAVVAATGVAAAATWLLGGGIGELDCAISNVLGNVAGMLCDGAKASCALKISTCTSAAMQGAALAMRHLRVRSNEGIVELAPEETIENFALLGNQGSDELDRLILEMIIHKKDAGA